MTSIVAVNLLAALYHESGHPSVAQGATLARSLARGRPFTEYPDLRPEAHRGRELTAEGLLQRFTFHSLDLIAGEDVTADMAKLGVVDMEALARRIHEAERAAIERGWTVIILDPSRPWIAFDELPMQAQEGRRRHPARPPLPSR
jgi:predicted nicotinamide N-methyase